MAQFYADIQGHRGQATREGSKESGIRGHVRGWDIGARVYVNHHTASGKDVAEVYVTAGSNGSTHDIRLGTFTLDDGVITRTSEANI